MSDVHTLSDKVPYVHEKIKQDARETFAVLMGIQADEVPETLVELWWEAQQMANKLQLGEMDVRDMALLVLINRTISDKPSEKNHRQATDKAAKGTSRHQ